MSLLRPLHLHDVGWGLLSYVALPHPQNMLQESFQKAMRSLETGVDGWSLPRNWKRLTPEKLIYNMRVPGPDRMLVIKQVGRWPIPSMKRAQQFLETVFSKVRCLPA